MYKLRKYLCWVFAFSCLVCLGIALRRTLYIVHRHYAFLPFAHLRVPAVFLIQAVICGVAWWTIWKEKPFARAFGIAASLIFVGVPLWGITFFSQSVWGNEGIVLAIGVAGVVAFSWSDKQHRVGKGSHEDGEIGSN